MPHPPLIIPAIGRGDERFVEQTAKASAEIGRRVSILDPETIILISPHAPINRDAFQIACCGEASGDFARFGAAHVALSMAIDEELGAAVERQAKRRGLSAVLEADSVTLDHGALVPLSFLIGDGQRKPDLLLLSISGLSAQSHARYGDAVRAAIEETGRRVVLVASGDLSHHLSKNGPYGATAEGPLFDKRVMKILGDGELSELFSFTDSFADAAGECALRPLQILAGVLGQDLLIPEVLSYESPFGTGYGVATLSPPAYRVPPPKLATGPDAWVRLAMRSVQHVVRNGKPLRLTADERRQLPDALTQERAGVFVTLRHQGDLRGCIGTTSATKPSIADEIVANAMSSATRDPRFRPIQINELDKLEVSVDVLDPAEPIASVTELDPEHYGIVVSSGWRLGLLLPRLDGIDTAEQQINIALQKAGISPDESYEIKRFKVTRHAN